MKAGLKQRLHRVSSIERGYGRLMNAMSDQIVCFLVLHRRCSKLPRRLSGEPELHGLYREHVSECDQRDTGFEARI